MTEDQIQFHGPVEHEAPSAADHHEAPAEPQLHASRYRRPTSTTATTSRRRVRGHLHNNVVCICLKSLLFVLYM